METEWRLASVATSINPSLKGKQSDTQNDVNISHLSSKRGEASAQKDDPFLLGRELPQHSHVLFLQALIGQRGEVCQHEKWFPPWQETCYTSSRLFEKNMFFPLCI